MEQHHVQLRVKNGGLLNVFVTTDRQYACSFCKSRNEQNKKDGSPNVYFFDTTND